jgi:hypothetical protein
MATIALNQYVGSWNGLQMYAKNFTTGGKLYIANEYNGGIVPRGKEIVSDVGFTLASGLVVADFAAFPSSGGTGVGIPTDLATNPIGWAKKIDSEGNGYFKKSEDSTSNEDTNGDGIIDSNDSPRNSANVLTQAMDWIKANPFLAAGIAIGAYLLFFQPKGRGKKKKLFGLI